MYVFGGVCKSRDECEKAEMFFNLSTIYFMNVMLKLMYCNVRVDINDDSISLTKKSDKFYSLSTFER